MFLRKYNRSSCSEFNWRHTRSCGCLRLDGQYESIRIGVYREHCTKAEKRGIITYLSKDEYLSIASKNCHYCGTLGVRKNNFTGATIPLNGVDRKDNELFYKLENSLPCCTRCNWMKGNMKYADFIESIRRIVSTVDRLTQIEWPKQNNSNPIKI